jgi:ricin-type beta-trefoil lectin protein
MLKRLTVAALAVAAIAGSSSQAHAFGFVPTDRPTTISIPFSKKVMNVEFGSSATGTALIQFHNVSGVLNDRFWFEPAPSFGADAYRIRPAHTNNMLLTPASAKEGAQIILRRRAEVGTSATSVWHVEGNGVGSQLARHLRNHSTGFVMNVERASTADSARIIQFRPTFGAPFNDDVQVS